MKKTIFTACSLIAFAIAGCRGPQGEMGPVGPAGPTGPTGATGTSDKQIRFEMSPGYGVGISDTSGYMLSPSVGIIKFDIDNYVGVDTVMFVAYLKTADPSADCMLELYDATDSTFIKGGSIESNSTQGVWVQSSNVYSNLPHKEITLTAYIKSGKNGVVVNAYPIYLFLYRN